MHRFTRLLLLLLLPVSLSAQTDVNVSNSPQSWKIDWEPSLAVDPNDPDHFVVAWMGIPSGIPVNVTIHTSVSTDGGQTWSVPLMQPHIVSDFGHADPSLAFGDSSEVFLAYIDFDNVAYDSGYVFVTRSIDGGFTWNTPVQAAAYGESPDIPIDRPWIAVDRGGGPSDGNVYLVTMSAFFHTGTRHLWLKRSTDDGQSWSALTQVDDQDHPIIGITPGVPAVDPNGMLTIMFYTWNFPTIPYPSFVFASSQDAGNSFAYFVGPRYNPTKDTLYQNGWALAADPSMPGHLASCWLDTLFGDEDIVWSQSTDGGQNWSAPARANDDPQGTGVGQDMCWLNFSQNGALGIGWRDRRYGGAGGDVPFDFFGAFSPDGGDSWYPDFRLASALSSHEHVERGNDFIGVAVTDSALSAAWADLRSSPAWEVYFSRADWQVITASDPARSGTGTHLMPVFPNPADAAAVVAWRLQKPSFVRLSLTDAAGRPVRTLADRKYTAGGHKVLVRTDDLPAGLYLLRMDTRAGSYTRKFVVAR